MFRLTVEKGEPKGAVFELKPGENTLGRSRASGVHLQSPDVSGLHARIQIAGGVASLENLSQFGTRVNGRPVTGEVSLSTGQRIEVGKTTVLVFELDGKAKPQTDREARTGEAGITSAAPGGVTRTLAASATRPPFTLGATRADAGGSEMTGALSRSDITRGASESDEEGVTHAMQTRAAAPEEIELLRTNEQKRVRRRMLIGVAITIFALILVFIFRPRTPPPETEIDWAQDAKGEYLDAFEPALSGGLKEGGYDLMYPGNKTFKKSAAAGGFVLDGWIGRKLDVPMRVILQEENETRLASMGRTEMVDDWIRQMSGSGGRWNFDKPSPAVAFLGKRNGVPSTRVSYLRDGDGSWFGTASIVRYGCRRIVARAEVPAAERVRAENMLSTKLIRVSDEFENAHWEYNPAAATFSEEEVLTQVRKDLERMAPATWDALKGLLTGLLTKAVLAGHKETETEAIRLLVKLRERQALWFNSQQLAFDAALMQGNRSKAAKIAEFTKAVFSNVEDQRYFAVRKWKIEL